MAVKEDYYSDDGSSVESSEQGTTAMTAETIAPPQPVGTTKMESLEFEASAPPANPNFFSDDGEDSEFILDNNEESSRNRDKKVTAAAGIATGIVGLLFCGVFGGLVAGGAVAYATTRPGAAGDAARAVGDVALAASEKAKEVNEKHKIVDKTKEAVDGAWSKAKEADKKHNIVGRSAEAVAGATQKVVELEREHRVVDRAVGAFVGAFDFLVKKVTGKDDDDSSRYDEQIGQQTQRGQGAVPKMDNNEFNSETKKLYSATVH